MYSREGRGRGRGSVYGWQGRDDYSRRQRSDNQDRFQDDNYGTQYSGSSRDVWDSYDNKRQRVTDTRDFSQQQYGYNRDDEPGSSQRPQKERPPPYLTGREIESRQESNQSWSKSKGTEQQGFWQDGGFTKRSSEPSRDAYINTRDQDLFNRDRGSFRSKEEFSRGNFREQDKTFNNDQQKSLHKSGGTGSLQDTYEHQNEFQKDYFRNQSHGKDFPSMQREYSQYEETSRVSQIWSERVPRDNKNFHENPPGERSFTDNDGKFEGSRRPKNDWNHEDSYRRSDNQWTDSRKRTFEGEQGPGRDIMGQWTDENNYREQNISKSEDYKNQWSSSRNSGPNRNKWEHQSSSKSGGLNEDNRSNDFHPYRDDVSYRDNEGQPRGSKDKGSHWNYPGQITGYRSEGAFGDDRGSRKPYGSNPQETGMSGYSRGYNDQVEKSSIVNCEPVQHQRAESGFKSYQDIDHLQSSRHESSEFVEEDNQAYSDDEMPDSGSDEKSSANNSDNFRKKGRKRPLKVYAEGIPMDVLNHEIKGNLRSMGFRVKSVDRIPKMNLFEIALFRNFKTPQIHQVNKLVRYRCNIIDSGEFMRRWRIFRKKVYEEKMLASQGKNVEDGGQSSANVLVKEEGQAGQNVSSDEKKEAQTPPVLFLNQNTPQQLPSGKRLKPIRVFIQELPMEYLKEDIRSELTKLGFKVRQVNRNKGLKIFQVQFTPTNNVLDVFKITKLGPHTVKMIEPKLLCNKPRFTNQVLPL